MSNLVLSEAMAIQLNSDVASEQAYTITAEKQSSLIIKIEGNHPFKLSIDCTVQADSSFTCLLLNDNGAEVEIDDRYLLEHDAKAVVAYSQLTSQRVVDNSDYKLAGEGAEIRVLSVSITSTDKLFNQNTNHLAAHTKANIDNYGVVLANGKCEMVVKNTIGKGYHNCETHQTSRLLTYDKSATGKILPILCIDDNEVTASHACSLGQPDENQIYYLQTRGLNYDEALQLITIGYLMPITKIIDDEKVNSVLKEEIETKVKQSCLK